MKVSPQLRERLFELLEERCGIGAPRGRAPGWMLSRLDRALRLLDAGPAQGDVLGFVRDSPEELERLAELVRVGETRFFRDPEQWQALDRLLLERPPSSSRMRALSAGCSTGEEAWSLGMLLASRVESPFRVVGVDRSSVALDEARSARYSDETLRHIPARYRESYVDIEGDQLCITEGLRHAVSFVQRDLLLGPPAGSYELIVCKNLLIYLKSESARRVLEALFRALSPGGLLLVARAELPRAKALGFPVVCLADGISLVQASGTW